MIVLLYHLNVTGVIIVIRILPGMDKKTDIACFGHVRNTRKDVKRVTLRDKAYKRIGGYAVDFINLQPQEKIVTTMRGTTTTTRKGDQQRQSVRG